MFDWTFIDKLEKNNTYKKALQHMKKSWVKDKNNKELVIRLGFLSWYTVVEWGCINPKDFDDTDYNLFEETLKETTDYGIKNFHDDADFLWIFGYMITLFSWYFGDDEELEKKGRDMLFKAYKLKKNDPIIKMVYLGSTNLSTNYTESCLEAKHIVKERFKGGGLLNEYFKEVLER